MAFQNSEGDSFSPISSNAIAPDFILNYDRTSLKNLAITHNYLSYERAHWPHKFRDRLQLSHL